MGSIIKKWLIWVGAFLALAGFFIPSPAIDFAPFKLDTSEGGLLSINSMALTGQAALYLVLAGIFVTAVLSFFSPRSSRQKIFLALSKGAGLALGITALLFIAIFVFELFGNISLEFFGVGFLSVNFRVTLALFILLLGYGLTGSGVMVELFEAVFQVNDVDQKTLPDFDSLPSVKVFPAFPADETVPPAEPVQLDAPVREEMPRLELVKGNAPPVVTISNTDFHIGRSSQNHFPVNDPQISRVHVRIREAQGKWFIQDQNSAGGTFVNDQQIQAQRLQDGDQIRIGQTVFKFYL